MLDRRYSGVSNSEHQPAEEDSVGSTRRFSIKRLSRRLRNQEGLRSPRSPKPVENDPEQGMPSRRRVTRDLDQDWTSSTTKEAHDGMADDDGGQDSVRESALSRNGNGNDQATNRLTGSDLSRTDTNSVLREEPLELGPWKTALDRTVEVLKAAHKASADLQKELKSHKNDLVRVKEVKEQLTALLAVDEDKDKKIARYKDAITSLKEISQDDKAKIALERAEIDKQKKDLDHDKLQQAKAHSTWVTQQRSSLENERKEMMREQNDQYTKRREDMEAQFKKKIAENDIELIAIRKSQSHLAAEVSSQMIVIQDRESDLEKCKKESERASRLIASYEGDIKESKEELAKIKSDFQLNSLTTERAQQSFAELYAQIDSMSLGFAQDTLKQDEFQEKEAALVALDQHFGSVPIDNSPDSQHLRAAHTQRIVSAAIVKHIWKPYSSEYTHSYPGSVDVFSTISQAISATSESGSGASVWTALTMRALKKHGESESSGLSQRAKAVVKETFPYLKHLTNRSPDELHRTIFELAISAINIWDVTQTSSLDISADLVLESKHHTEWHSDALEPILTDDVSKTYPRIFTLFPRILAASSKDANELVFPGRGLPEWCPLVVRGKERKEAKANLVAKMYKEADNQMHDMTQDGRQSRQRSLGNQEEI